MLFMEAGTDQPSVHQQISNDDQIFSSSTKDYNSLMDQPPIQSQPQSQEHTDLFVSNEPSNNMATELTSLGSPYQNGAERASNGDFRSTSAMSANDSDMEQPDRASAPPRSGFDMEQIREQVKNKQRQFADRFREKQADQENFEASRSGPSDDNDMEADLRSAPRRKGRSKKAPVQDAEALRFQELKRVYSKKKATNQLSIEEEIQFIKDKSDESSRLRKIERDEEWDRLDREVSPESEDELFVREAPSYSDMHADDEEPTEGSKKVLRKRRRDEEAGDGEPRKLSKPKNGNKKGNVVPGTDYTEEDADNILHHAKEEAKTKATKPKRARKPAKDSGPTMTNLNSMRGGNVFNDTAAVSSLPDQPMIQQQGGQRSDALKKLVASVPAEARATANVDKKYLGTAIKDFAPNTVSPAADGNWAIKGMKSTLKHYQVLGTAFMRKREEAEEDPRGGILADEMGLGKTIMMLANIVNGKPHKGKPRATLIVCSPALAKQWLSEIKLHTVKAKRHSDHGIRSAIGHYSGSRTTAYPLEEFLADQDIVLTTYHEVMGSCPKMKPPVDLVTAAQKDAWWKEQLEAERGPLHRVHWLRVVLDEASAIKNHTSHTSLACRALSANHYWAITGTPVQNSIKEFYPYFQFIREPNTGSFKIFKENFCTREDPSGSDRLNVFLRKFMIRRTHIDTLFNAKLLDLPQPHERTVRVEFNQVERQIYEIVKKRFIQRINKYSKEGSLEKQYNHIWTMMLRLRQLCGHILLIQGTVIDLLEREDFEKLNSLTTNEHEMADEGAALLIHLRNVLRADNSVKTIEGGLGSSIVAEQELLPTNMTPRDEIEADTGGLHGLNFQFSKYLESLRNSQHWVAIKQRTLCCQCHQPPLDPQVTSCFHIYCLTCLTNLKHRAARRSQDGATCSECGDKFTTSQPCQGIDTFRTCDSPTGASDHNASQTNGKGKKRDLNMEDWISMKGEVLPSAKTQAVKAQVMNWLEEDPECKIIIFTQFLDMIRILTKICETEAWDHCKYTGSMSQDARDRSVKEFAADKDKRILLATLKCGGMGLNLTMASKVICMDPWFNESVESQAFGRVFRIGQTRETHLVKLVVGNTVDQKLTDMKLNKQLEINAVMEQKERFNTHDLLRLFGDVGEDDQGNSFIFASEETGPEHLRVVEEDEEDENQAMGNEA